jgi:two-component system cell cycle response regulator DivK
VTDSRNALDVAREFSPDLVITDIQLPHVSGLDLIRLLRADDQLANVPIMAVTAYAARGDEERIRAAGAQAYVSKPISVVKFAETVEQLLPKPEPATQM